MPLGKILITQEASRTIQYFKPEVASLLIRHHLGDWGNLTEKDALQNEIAVLLGMRVRSRYRVATGQILSIVTEANRQITKILLAHEE